MRVDEGTEFAKWALFGNGHSVLNLANLVFVDFFCTAIIILAFACSSCSFLGGLLQVCQRWQLLSLEA